jgi:hypothetical protein
VPFLLTNDQVFFWSHAFRMMHGERIYADFFSGTPPGSDLVFFYAFRVFGTNVWVTNLVFVVVGVLLAAVCWLIARRVLPPLAASFVVAFIVVTMYARSPDATHHWFSIVIALLGLWILLDDATPRRAALAGALFGLASFFTQTRGAFAVVGVGIFFLLRDLEDPHRRETGRCIAALIGSSTAVISLLLLPYVVPAGISTVFFNLIRFVAISESAKGAEYYLSGLPAVPPWYHLPDFLSFVMVYALAPAIYFAFLYRWFRRRQAQDEVLLLICLLGLFAFLEIARTPNWVRIFGGASPAIILAVAMLRGSRIGAKLVSSALGVLALLCAALQLASVHGTRSETVRLPAGVVALQPSPRTDKLNWVAAHTVPEEYFLEAQWPGMYLPLKLRDPSYGDVWVAPPSAAVPAVGAALDRRRVRYVLVPAHLRETGSAADFQAYVQTHYRLLHVFADESQVWERLTELPRSPSGR